MSQTLAGFAQDELDPEGGEQSQPEHCGVGWQGVEVAGAARG